MRKLYVVPILLAISLTGCSSGDNQASAPPGDANANAAPSVARNAPPPAQAQPPVLTPLEPTLPLIKPEAKPAPEAVTKASGNANMTPPATSSKGTGPRLVVPLGNIDFGNVNQGKSITRNLVIKNTGRTDLNIESVVPS